MAGNLLLARVVALPWYEESDFAQFQPARPHNRVEASYEQWRRAASSKIFRELANGHAVEIISISPAGYRAWIVEKGLSDSCESRLRYVEALSAGACVAPPARASLS